MIYMIIILECLLVNLFEGRVEKEALKMKNSQLLEIPSGNTGFKIKYVDLKCQSLMSGLKFIKQKFYRSGISKRMKEFATLGRSY